MHRMSKRILAIGMPLAVTAASGAAVAFWTTGGSGTGTAGTSTGAASLVVASHTAPNDLAPGVPAGAITVTVRNPGPASATVAQVVATIASVTPVGANSCLT